MYGRAGPGGSRGDFDTYGTPSLALDYCAVFQAESLTPQCRLEEPRAQHAVSRCRRPPNKLPTQMSAGQPMLFSSVPRRRRTRSAPWPARLQNGGLLCKRDAGQPGEPAGPLCRLSLIRQSSAPSRTRSGGTRACSDSQAPERNKSTRTAASGCVLCFRYHAKVRSSKQRFCATRGRARSSPSSQKWAPRRCA